MGEKTRLRNELVDGLKARGAVKDGRVEAALRSVGRHHFLPGRPLEDVYSDTALATHRDGAGLAISSSSQPAIMAVMLEQLDLAPGHRVLEVGAGTGYNAALLGRLVEPGGRVVSVDIDPAIVDEARAGLERCGAANVEVVAGDGAGGWPEAAPYDRVIATCSADEVPAAWVRQLALGGRIVLPLELTRAVMFSVALEPDGACLRSVSTSPCGFMRIRGSLAAGRAEPLRVADGVFLEVAERPASAERVAQWLDGPCSTTAVTPTASVEQFFGLRLWLGLVDPGSCSMMLSPEVAEDRRWPALWRVGGSAFTVGVLAADGLAVLHRDDDASPPVLRGYGEPSAADRFRRGVASWREAGRPGGSGPRVTACPPDAPAEPPPGAHVLRRRFSNLLVELS